MSVVPVCQHSPSQEVRHLCYSLTLHVQSADAHKCQLLIGMSEELQAQLAYSALTEPFSCTATSGSFCPIMRRPNEGTSGLQHEALFAHFRPFSTIISYPRTTLPGTRR